MKKASLIMIAMTLVFTAFTVGFILGRNADHNRVSISVSHAPKQTDPPQATTPTELTPIDINTATVQQLSSLPGIGQVLAQRIISYRTANGPFESLADLTKVEGVGEKKLEAILEYITLGGQS
jgi:comEA protein